MKLDHSSKNFFKAFLEVDLKPNLGLFVTIRKIDIAVEDSCSSSCNHHSVLVIHKGELLNLYSLHKIGTAFLAVYVLKYVSLKVVRKSHWHLKIVKLEIEDSMCLLLLLRVALPWK